MLQKIIHLLQRLVGCSKAFPGACREFGMKVAVARFWDTLIPTGKSKKYIKTLSDYMSEELALLTDRYNAGEWSAPEGKTILEKTPVWVCWWQGEESMPPIVKACISRMRSLLPKTARLHLITWETIGKYIDLPETVIEKHRNGIISAAHLSDILRFGLLSQYGGAWLDATVYLTKAFPEKLLTQDFYTQRFRDWESCPREACRGKWCGFFLGGSTRCAVFAYMYEALVYWWLRHDRVVDYVFFDYILWAGYQGVEKIRTTIDAVAPNNENIWLLAKHLNDAYTPEAYEALLGQNDFFKLSYKGRLEQQTPSGEKTVYSHILEENGII